MAPLSCPGSASRDRRGRDLLAALVFRRREAKSRPFEERARRSCPDDRPDKHRTTCLDHAWSRPPSPCSPPPPPPARAERRPCARARRGRGRGADAAEHHRAAHRRPGDGVDAGDEDGQQGDEAQGGDDEELLRELPPVLPVAHDDAHRAVRPQPRRALQPGARRGLRRLQRAPREQQPRAVDAGGRLSDRLHRQVPERVRVAGRVRDAPPTSPGAGTTGGSWRPRTRSTSATR